MKKALTLSILLMGILVGHAQVTIPDANFVLFLNNNGYAGCMTGNVMDTTCIQSMNVQFLDISNQNISDITGIEYFNALLNFNCRDNQISFINVLPDMQNLDCSNNPLIA